MIDSCNGLNGLDVVPTECDEQSVPEGSANGRKVSGTRETVKTSFPAKIAGCVKSLFNYSVEKIPNLTSKLMAGLFASQFLPMAGAEPVYGSSNVSYVSYASYFNTTVATLINRLPVIIECIPGDPSSPTSFRDVSEFICNVQLME